ncbi:MAG: peptidoglycan editing factor PgeF [Betaproteobacteria bacterium]|nr:peptidoglycan editing factor PgeF [Betaproteobacteria bacterium]
MKTIVPDWSAPANVRAFFTMRAGGVSQPPYASLNLGDHVGDVPQAVTANRLRVASMLPTEPVWLNQVHGVQAVDAANPQTRDADAVFARVSGTVCAVMVADCLPVLFCDRVGRAVGAAHAGWRGLSGGVLEACIAAMSCPPDELLAWLGPAIGPDAFEVGPEVREHFVVDDAQTASCFKQGRGDRWMADIFALARRRLSRAGVRDDAVFGGDECTFSDAARFFSYRRDGRTGRMGAFIWLDPLR